MRIPPSCQSMKVLKNKLSGKINVAYHWDLESIIFSPSYFFLTLQLNPWYPYKLVALKNYLKTHCFNLIGLGRVPHSSKAWEFVVSLFSLFSWAMRHCIQPPAQKPPSSICAGSFAAVQVKWAGTTLPSDLVGPKVQIWAVKMSYLASWSAHPSAREKDAMFWMKAEHSCGCDIVEAWDGNSHCSLCRWIINLLPQLLVSMLITSVRPLHSPVSTAPRHRAASLLKWIPQSSLMQ